MTKEQLTLAISKAQKAYLDRYLVMPERVQIDRSWERILFSGLQARKINGVPVHPFDMSLDDIVLQGGGGTVSVAFSSFI
jgi:hypothetical protein